MTMHISFDDRRTRYLLFFLLALSINVIDNMLIRSMENPRAQIVAAVGASFDVVALVTAIYYWLLVRPGIQARSSLVPIALVAILRATYLVPTTATTRVALAALCELGLIAFIIVQVRQKIRRWPSANGERDPIDAIRAVLAPVFVMPFASRMFAVEFGVLYYALFSWRAKPHVPKGAKAFSMHKRAAAPDLFFALAIASFVEIPPIHLLIGHWSPMGAWIATGLSLYGTIWLLGLGRSIELRPALVGPYHLDLRYGLLFRLRIPREKILRVRRAGLGDATSAVVVPKRREPNLWIEFVGCIDAEGLFGVRKRLNRVAVAADEVLAFEQALRELIGTE
jgi:hypothetical protein